MAFTLPAVTAVRANSAGHRHGSRIDRRVKAIIHGSAAHGSDHEIRPQSRTYGLRNGERGHGGGTAGRDRQVRRRKTTPVPAAKSTVPSHSRWASQSGTPRCSVVQ